MAQFESLNSVVHRYEDFINDVLKEDLKKIDHQLHVVNCKIAEFIQIKQALDALDDKELVNGPFKTKVDIGRNFYIQAKVEDTSKLLYHVGLGYHVQLSKSEIKKVVDVHMKAYEEGAKKLREKSAKVKAHIKLMLLSLGELQNINMNTEVS